MQLYFTRYVVDVASYIEENKADFKHQALEFYKEYLTVN